MLQRAAVFLDAPKPGQARPIVDLKYPFLNVRPIDEAGKTLVFVVQHPKQKVTKINLIFSGSALIWSGFIIGDNNRTWPFLFPDVIVCVQTVVLISGKESDPQ